MPRLGAHLSAAGGSWRAVEAAAVVGCESVQLFLRPPTRWAAPAVTAAEPARFRAAAAAAGLGGVCFAHAPYLLNPASEDRVLRERSVAVLVEELRRGGALGLSGVVLHPGSAGEGDRDEAEARCRAAIAEAVGRAGADAAPLLLEGTAGAGGQLGRGPAELARLVEAAGRGRVGVCLDTAHLWGAGYDLLHGGWERVLGELAEHWGISAPHLLHGNDTTVELGSRRDRHAPPGDGRLGERFYRTLLADGRCAGTPIVLEIPPGQGNALIRRALARLRRWERKKP
ncbi:MAG: deoxyribonuclease IV [Thermoanaerobaculaceae bacterium]|nr:deoxyribonuclease IV [Thermoanaerobaculaceae bacterium]TAM52342.1 MAG: deoxyribonuclease IV [Acidobacteriota bacterium]